jgi:MinD-like ATPase involved in chromosome partitioning or flagellar assembly
VTNDLHIAVIGAPGLASVLERSGRFYKVWRYQTTGQLREGIKELSGLNVPKLTFLFADNTPNDIADMSFGDLIGKLTQRSYRVVLVECSGVGRDVVATNPGAGLIPAPITCNLVLGAISDRGAGMIEPVGEAWGFEAFNPNDPSAVDHLPASDADLFGDLLGAFGSEELGLDSSWESGPATSPVAPAAPSPVAQPASWGQAAEPVSQAAPVAPWEQTAAPVAQVAPWEQAAAPVAQTAPWEQAAAPVAQVAPVAPWEQASAPSPVAQVAPWEQAAAPSAPVASAWDTAAQSWGEAAVVASPVNDAVGLTAMPTPSVVGGRKGIVLAVTVAKGGAGKSSLTLNLGVWAALKLRAAGRTVCIVDANWQQADIGKQINQYTPNIATLSKNPGDVNAAGISKYMYRRNDLNTSFLLGPADERERNPTWITSDLYCKSIGALRELYDYIFVDTPVAEPYHELFSNFILQEADYLIVPVNPSWPTLANTESWLNHITLAKHASGEGFNEQRIGVVLNRAEDGVDMSESDVQSELGRWRYLGAVPDSKEWRRAANNNEIIATRNIPEISQAFSRVLFAVLGEEALLMDIPTSEDAGGKKRGWRRARS